MTTEPSHYQLRKIKHVGIDEIFWGKRILTVILDLETGDPIDVLPDRKPDTLRSFLEYFKNVQGNAARPVFVADMWGEFREALQTVYGADLLQVADRFHIQAKIREDLRDSARAILLSPAKKIHSINEKIKYVIQCFLRSRALTEDAPTMNGVRPEQLAQLRSVLTLATDLRDLWDCADVPQGEDHMKAWRIKRAGVERQLKLEKVPGGHFYRLDALLGGWRKEILAYLNPKLTLSGGQRPTTGRLEASNGKIRQLLLRSSVRSRRAFTAEMSIWDDQTQYIRIRKRIFHHLSTSPLELQHRMSHLRPVVQACRCGLPADRLATCQIETALVWDRPMGDQVVKAVIEQPTIQCPSCGARWTVPHGCEDNITPLLRDDILAWRREGLSFRTLHRMTGVPQSRLRKVVGEDTAQPDLLFPELIGVQRWRWRNQPYWIISDPRQGTLVDLVSVTKAEDSEDLRSWLLNASAHGTRQVLVNSLALSHAIPAPLVALADRLTVMNSVHTTLKDVLRQVLKDIPVNTLRTVEFSRVRFLFLSNGRRYRRLDDRLNEITLKNRLSVLEKDPRFELVCIAKKQIVSLRSIFELKSESDIQISLDRWITETRRLAHDISWHTRPRPGQRGFVFGFRDATELLEQNQSTVVAGLLLHSSQGVSLASSRRLIGRLNGHPARMQPEFEHLRRTALFSLGTRAETITQPQKLP